jgi:hypothetical protein
MMKRLFSLTGIILVSALLAACGGSGGGDATTDVSQTATLGIVLTDNDTDDYCEAIATITDIELIGESGKQPVFEGSLVVDLFKLRDYVELVEIADGVEPDTISKIRLILSSLVLSTCDMDGNVEATVPAKLVGNGKIDILPDEKIDILPGAVLFITLDFDMDKSLKITERGGSGKPPIVRPVIFAKAGIRPGFKNGLTRVSGEITRINETPTAFLLCVNDLMATPQGDENSDVGERCVKTNINEGTGVFGSDGQPVRASVLEIGNLVTVVGKLGLPDDQPIPLPEAAAADSDSDSDSESDSDSDDGSTSPKPPLQFVLDAIVIEIGAPGTFATVRGELKSEIVDGMYRFLVGGDQGFDPDTVLKGVLYPTSRIIDARGENVDPLTLGDGDGALVDGVVIRSEIESEVDALRTAVMIVRGGEGGPGPEERVLIGKVLGIDESVEQVRVATGAGDRCVLADDATVLFIAEVEGSIEIVEGKISDLSESELIVNFGVEDVGGCFDANTIISQTARKEPAPEPVENP